MENGNVYECKTCSLVTNNKKDYGKHLLTKKHQKLSNINQTLTSFSPKHICKICLKEYKSNVGLWKHKKVCTEDKPIEDKPIEDKDEIIELLKKKNTEFKNIILTFMKNNSELQEKVLKCL